MFSFFKWRKVGSVETDIPNVKTATETFHNISDDLRLVHRTKGAADLFATIWLQRKINSTWYDRAFMYSSLSKGITEDTTFLLHHEEHNFDPFKIK
jgi:hypothetical protein